MIDLVAFKQRMEYADGGPWIEPADLITEDTVIFLSKYSAEKVRTLFKKTSNRPPYATWQWKQRCPTCDAVWIAIGSKTDALNYVQFFGCKSNAKHGWNVKDAECVDCKLIRKAKEVARTRPPLTNEEWIHLRRRNTEQFITKYVNADRSWIEQSDMHNNLKSMRYELSGCDQDYIRDHIKAMDYNDFLETPYWKAIAYVCRMKSGWKCSLCSSKDMLHVHHRTYEIHGSEIDHIEKDLIVLCKQCHETFHSERQVFNG